MQGRALVIAVGLASTMLACSSSSGNSGFPDPNASSSGSSGGSFGMPDGGGDGGTTGMPVGNTPPCDDAVTGGTPADHAKAMGLCTNAATDGYGLVSATFTRGYKRTDAPKAEQAGVLAKFGDVIRPREGKMLTVLSTGYAKEFDGTGNAPFGGDSLSGTNGKDWWGAKRGKGNGTAPPGFPAALRSLF